MNIIGDVLGLNVENQSDGGTRRTGTGSTGAAPGSGSGSSSANGPAAGEPGPRKPGASGEANAEGNPEAK